VLLLTGCPYGSEFPLGSPAEGIDDAALLGTWKPTAESEEDFSLTISYAGGAPLTLTAESPGEETASYPAFASAVGGEHFLNIQDTAEAGQWYFANYRLHEGRLRLRLVDDELIGSQTFASARELRAFLQRNLETCACMAGRRRGVGLLELAPKADHPAARLPPLSASTARRLSVAVARQTRRSTPSRCIKSKALVRLRRRRT
jgi:hypothetical protein